MSSETSTNVGADLQVGPRDQSLQPWQLFTLAGLIGATVVVFVSRGQTPAGVVLLSLTIFTAAVVGIAAWRTFMPFTAKDQPPPPQVLGGRTRAALEREKTLVLRSIKELEFDRAMGKVSEKDFAEMSARLRSRAARLIRQLDSGASYREQIEKEVARRVGEAGSKEQDPAYISKVEPTYVGRVSKRPAANACTGCGTENDADARFCKHCGASLESAK